MTETKQIGIKLLDTSRRSKVCISQRLDRIVTRNENLFFLQITHFVIENDGKIAPTDAFSFQPKSPLLLDVTICRARTIGTQHVNMSLESGTRHFTWFLDVLHAFLSVSELLWTLFYY